MTNQKNMERVTQSNSNSEDDLHLSSINNGNNDCNFLLSDKKNGDTSMFDDSYLAMVSCDENIRIYFISIFLNLCPLIERHFSLLSYSISRFFLTKLL